MITSSKNAPWPLDVPLKLRQAVLTAPSKVRMKLFTLDNRLILRVIGALAGDDKRAVCASLEKAFALRDGR
jgi:mRNA interferase MazF